MPVAMTPKRAAKIEAKIEAKARKKQARKESILTATGKLLHDQRQALALSQKEVAEAIGFSNVFLGKIEFGKCDLPVKHVAKIAKILKLEKNDILFSLKHDLSNRLDQKANR